MTTALGSANAGDLSHRTDSPPSPSALASLSAIRGLPEPCEGYFSTSDGTALRYTHWPAAESRRQGSVLYLNGRTEFIEKNIDPCAILCGSGLDVWTFDWRGQGLSTRALADSEKGHIADYQLYLDDLHQFVSEITDLQDSQGRTIMLAHSMGGHIGLRYLHDHPGLINSAVFSAPMLDLSVNRAWLRWLNALLIGLGFGESYALGTGRFRFVYNNPDDPTDNGGIEDYRERIKQVRALTHDVEKFRAIQGLIRDNPALALGGPTAAWLDATFRSINLTWSPGYAEAITTPLLIVGGGFDQVVVTARQEEMAKRLPNGQFQVIDKAAHELLIECDDVRASFLQKLADFAEVRIDQPPISLRGCVRRD